MGALFFSLVFLLNSSCSQAQVLGISRNEAAEYLRKGETGFISRAKLPADFTLAVSKLKELSIIHPAAPFYAWLIVSEAKTGETEPGLPPGNTELLLLCAALDSPSGTAQKEAAGKLIPVILTMDNSQTIHDILGFLDSGQGFRASMHEILSPAAKVRSACLYRLGLFEEIQELLRYNSGENFSEEIPKKLNSDDWDRALALLAAWENAKSKGETTENIRQEILSFLFNAPFGELLRWTHEEALARKSILSPIESMALTGRYSPGNYRITLSVLRPALIDGGLIFFRFPSLLNDLGRAYQYTPSMREEGVKLFGSWIKILESPGSPLTLPSPFDADPDNSVDYRYGELRTFVKNSPPEIIKGIKYPLLFYLGRMERAREKFSESTGFFRQALEIAPDNLQSDACIWYMLMNAMSVSPQAAIPLVRETMPQWNDVSYFADVLDRLSCYLAGRRQWQELYNLFTGLEKRISGGAHHSGASLAQYAWITGRAAEEGYFKTERTAQDFFRIAFNEGNWSFYYRAMAASKLDETFVPEGNNTPSAQPLIAPRQDIRENSDAGAKNREETDFILGLLEYGAASHVLSFIEKYEAELGVTELRNIAEALASLSMWKESLDLVSRYTAREDYTINREDLLLFYPRPFLQLVEKYSGEAELGEEILYGLIRTESYFMPEIVSRSGAVGLAQLMVPTAQEMAGRIARQGGKDYRPVDNEILKDPETNIHIGSYYLKYLVRQLRTPITALLAYNGGIGRMRRWLTADRQHSDGGLPPDLFLETIEFNETREYGRRVLAAAAIYGYLYYGLSMEEVAEDIYTAKPQ